MIGYNLVCICGLVIPLLLGYILRNSYHIVSYRVVSPEVRLLLSLVSDLKIFTLRFSSMPTTGRFADESSLFRVSNHYEVSLEKLPDVSPLISIYPKTVFTFRKSAIPFLAVA